MKILFLILILVLTSACSTMVKEVCSGDSDRCPSKEFRESSLGRRNR